VAAGVSARVPGPGDWDSRRLDRDRLRPDTLAVRGGLVRSEFDETSEALFLTQGYVYPTAADAEAAVAGELDRFQYSRYANPTVSTFEERLRLLEGAEACTGTATKMAAVFTALAALVSSGSRVVAARALFGPTVVVFDEILARWGCGSTTTCSRSGSRRWPRPRTSCSFETPSNPMQDLMDIAAVSRLAHAAGATVVVDNVFATPVFSRPLEHGAGVVVYSATKHIDGQGRVLDGAILGTAGLLGGTVVTFTLAAPDEPEAATKATFAVLDALRVVDVSNNLGDAKSLVTHPATTTHRRLGLVVM